MGGLQYHIGRSEIIVLVYFCILCTLVFLYCKDVFAILSYPMPATVGNMTILTVAGRACHGQGGLCMPSTAC